MKVPNAVRYAATSALAAAFPVVSLYARNPQYPLAEAGPCVAWAALGGLAFYLLLLGFFRNASKAAVLTLPAVALFFLYGVFSTVADPRPGEEIGETRVYVGGAAELCYALLWAGLGAMLLVARRRRPPDTLARVTAAIVACTFAIPTLVLAPWAARRLAGMRLAPARVAAATAVAPEDAPDIYDVVLDGYTRQDILQALFGVDNREFLEALRARGFFVAERARANYLQTHLSLASTLNFRYIDDVIDPSQPVVVERCTRLTMDSEVSRFLKARGYTYVNVSSGFWATAPNWAADVELGTPGLDVREFQRAITRMTPLWEWAPRGLRFEQLVHQRRILFGLDSLPEVAAMGGRKFVLAHVICPHPPFVFDRDGGTLAFGNALSLIDGENSPIPRDQYAWGYREQVLFLNKKVLETVDGILAHYPPDRRPVIVLHGDHGSGMLFDYEHPELAYMPERTSILLAMLLPADRSFEVGDAMTPVNLYRILFDGLFDAKLPLLPDKTYYVPSIHPARYAEVPASACDPATSAPPGSSGR